MSDKKSQQTLIERRRALLGALRTYYDVPFHPVRGEGQWLWDERGTQVLDAYNNVAHVGHCHPHVVEALCNQARQLNTNSRYIYESIVDYAERLAATIGPGYGCMFTCTGSEANDLAWRLASTFTRNTGVIITDHGYHGNTTFLDSIDGTSTKPRSADWCVRVPAPKTADWQDARDFRSSSLQYAKRVDAAIDRLAAVGHRPGAFFFDSYFCTDGVHLPPPGCMAAALERIRQAGGLIVVDEVQGGLARSGSHVWGFQRLGVEPDIVVMGKPMGNGHPIGVAAARKEIIDHFYSVDRYFNTFAGNPVSCAVGIAVLDVVEREGLQENARKMGRQIGDALEDLAARHPIIGAIRGQGLLWGVELVLDRATMAPAGEQARWIINEMCRKGVLIGLTGANRKARNILKIRPPMVFDEIGVRLLVSTMSDTLQATK